MKIKYGIIDNNIDVTEICYTKLLNKNIITIPSGDNNRVNHFTDPIIHVLKSIFIVNDQDEELEYNNTLKITIDINTNKIISSPDIEIDNKISVIHNKLKIDYGNFYEELPEQKMVVRYLTGCEKVLEIGGNIGRNSLIIGHILREQNNNNFVSLECDADIASQLQHNRDLNNLNFFIESSALSKRNLIQIGWETIESDIVLDGYKKVNNITFDELYLKYNIEFDTLVLDCEGSFYYILMDMPEILNNIKLIIMENDYTNILHKHYIDAILRQNNFYIDYTESGGWGDCYNNFFEVWKK